MQIVIDIPESILNAIQADEMISREQLAVLQMHILNGTPLPKGHGRKFEEIVVEYPPAELCTYPEYRGKPYFSIKYEENGEHFIGFGTYKPEVLSSYLQEYFIASTIIEADKESEEQT
mgnify:CR=1 FL=1